MKVVRFIGISILAGGLIGVAVIWAFAALTGSEADSDEPTLEFSGDDAFTAPRLPEPIEKPQAVLTTQDGEPYDLVEETNGKITLLFVGYTSCPDVCPAHLATIAAALDRVPPDVRGAITVVFATSDPERDSPEVLLDYLANFNPDFIGLTGSLEQMQAFQEALGMNPATKDLGSEDASGGYTVSHASYVIAFGRDNLGRLVFPTGIALDDWVQDLTKLVREGVAGG